MRPDVRAGGWAALALAASTPALADEPPPPPPPPAAVAPAAPPPPIEATVGILDLRTVGLGDAARGALAEALTSALTRAGYVAVLPERLREAMAATPWNAACVVGPCLVELHGRTAIDRGLQVGLVSTGANHDFVVTLVDTARGVPVAQLQRSCAVCTTEEALAATTAAAIEVLATPLSPPPVVTAPAPAPPPWSRPRLRKAGYGLLASAAVISIAGLALHDSYPDLGAGTVGAGLTLAVAGGGCLAASFHF